MPYLLRLLLTLLATVGVHVFLERPAKAATPTTAATGLVLDHISIEVVGAKGPDVILIPGLSTPREVWRPIAQSLSATHRVHLVQVRGFGEPAGANAQGPILAPMVEDLARYIAEKKLKSPAVIGHSMGGLAALMLAVNHPDLPGRLMIVDSLPWLGVLAAPAGMDVTVAMVEPRARMMREALLATYGKPTDPKSVEANVVGQVLDAAAMEKLRAWGAIADPRVTAQLVYDDLTTDLRGGIAAIRVPVTVIYPTNDLSQRKEMADAVYRAQYKSLAQARFFDIAGAAHFVMLDQPARFESAVRAFLAPAD
jgi:pimeloyl-ACP methyl ester carboxylesterase